jgi:transketolase
MRLCRNEVPQIFNDSYDPKIGKGVVLREGKDVTIIGCGVPLTRCLQAAQDLSAKGIDTCVVEMHTIKPLDAELVAKCADETGAIVTVEEHSIIGGLGGAVAECLISGRPVPQEFVGVNDRFAETGPYDVIMDNYGLAVADIVASAERAIKRKGS